MKKVFGFFLASIVLSCAGFVTAQGPLSVLQTNLPPSIDTTAHPMNEDVTMFYDSLTPYGDWFWAEPYGWVWSPRQSASVGWRPYTDGSWAYTDCGWTWVSDWSWGWAPFHYGRWFFHEHRGWCWAPDRVWGPAWVSWHFGDAWCGWAPLPPHVAWEATVNWDTLISPFGWCFVAREDFLRPHLRDHVVVAARNVTLLRETRNVTRFEVREKRVYNASISAEQIEHFTGKPVGRLKLVDVDSAGARGRVGHELRVFRPAPQPGAVVSTRRPEPPAPVRAAPTFDELRRAEAERARIESAQRAQRDSLERWHERELERPPQGLSPGELQERHQAEHQALNEQWSRERQLFEHREPASPQRPGGRQRASDAGGRERSDR